VSALTLALCGLTCGQSMTVVMGLCSGMSGRRLWYSVDNLIFPFGVIVLAVNGVVGRTVCVS